MNAHFLGIDVGLSGARAAVVDQAGRLCGSGRSMIADEASGNRFERDPLLWRDEVFHAARLAVRDAGVSSVEGIGVGALGPAPILLDQSNRPVAPAPLFGLDTRSEPQRQHLRLRHGLSEEELGPDHAIPKLAWIKENRPEAFERASLCVDVTGFVVGELTGRWIMDPITREYHVSSKIPAPIELPETVPADQIAAALTSVAASALGLRSGIPVVAGSIDSYVDIAGTGAVRPGDSCLLAGTTLILGSIVETADASSALRLTRAIGNGMFLGGWTSTFGSTVDWMRSLLPRVTKEHGEPGTILMLPYLEGERAPVWDACATGVLLGLRQRTTPDELFRAAVDGVVLSALDIAERLQRTTGPIAVFRATGGALRLAALCQSLADALGANLEVVESGEAVAPARLAASALGISIESPAARIVPPQPKRHAAYMRRLELYRALYRAAAPLMKQLDDLTAEEDRCRME